MFAVLNKLNSVVIAMYDVLYVLYYCTKYGSIKLVYNMS